MGFTIAPNPGRRAFFRSGALSAAAFALGAATRPVAAQTSVPPHASTHAADAADPVSPESIGAARRVGETLVTFGTAGGTGAMQRFETPSGKAPFAIVAGGPHSFNGQQDDLLLWGYNRGDAGTKLVADEPSFGFELEANVDDGPSATPQNDHFFEWNFDWSNTAGTVGRRLLAFRSNRYDPDRYTTWSFIISGSQTPGFFLIQDFSGHELFLVTPDGDAQVNRNLLVVGQLAVLGNVVRFDAPYLLNAFSWANGQLSLTAAHDNVTPLRLVAAPGQIPPLVGMTGGATYMEMIATRLTGERRNRFLLRIDGRMEWGSGSGMADSGIGRSGAGTLDVSGNVRIAPGPGQKTGFFGAAPVARPGAIPSPASDTSGTKAAIDAIRNALRTLGLTA